MARALGIDASPSGGGRTATALEEVLRATGAAGSEVVSLAEVDTGEVCERIEGSAIVVFGTPTYRATFAWPMKKLLDEIPRGMWGEELDPLRGKAVGIVATGATKDHFLSLDDLRNVLAGFFAAHVLPPGLYVPHGGFAADGVLEVGYRELAGTQGRGLRALADALAHSEQLREISPAV